MKEEGSLTNEVLTKYETKKSILSKAKQILSKNWIKWALLILVLGASYAIFMYADMLDTINNSIAFTKAFFNGKFFEFYELSVEMAVTRYAANYSVPIYLLLSIWNLPIFVLSGALGVDFITWWVGLLWSKTFIVMFALLSSYMIYKILLLCNIKKKRAYLGVFLFLSSIIVFDVIFVTVQLDIIPIFFMLLGLYGYLKKDNVLFFLSFTIAVPFKMFALLLALPLILLRQKNLLKAGGTWISMTALLIIEKILYSGSAVYKYALSAQTRDAMMQLQNSRNKYGKTIFNIFSFIYLFGSIFLYS